MFRGDNIARVNDDHVHSMMRVTVDGDLRRRTRAGLGVFRKERWSNETFHWEQLVTSDTRQEPVQVLESFTLACVLQDDKVFINATIRGRPYILGEVSLGVDRGFSFSVLSVGGMQISGRVTCATVKS
jgi:hypothetical protein